MNITEALKFAERISKGYRWMVYDEVLRQLVVYERRYGAHKTRTIITTTDEQVAFENLINEG